MEKTSEHIEGQDEWRTLTEGIDPTDKNETEQIELLSEMPIEGGIAHFRLVPFSDPEYSDSPKTFVIDGTTEVQAVEFDQIKNSELKRLDLSITADIPGKDVCVQVNMMYGESNIFGSTLLRHPHNPKGDLELPFWIKYAKFPCDAADMLGHAGRIGTDATLKTLGQIKVNFSKIHTIGGDN